MLPSLLILKASWGLIVPPFIITSHCPAVSLGPGNLIFLLARNAALELEVRYGGEKGKAREKRILEPHLTDTNESCAITW